MRPLRALCLAALAAGCQPSGAEAPALPLLPVAPSAGAPSPAASSAGASSAGAEPPSGSNGSPPATSNAPRLADSVAGPRVHPVASASAPSAPKAASPETWERRLARFYASYSAGSSARAAAYRELFAPRLQRFIGLHDVSLDQVVRTVETFFQDKENPRYLLVGAVQETPGPNGAVLLAHLAVTWQEACPEEWADPGFSCQREARLDAVLETDAAGRVTAYDEVAAPRDRYRVVAKDVSGFDEPHSRCETDLARLATVDLPEGTIVLATGRSILSLICGPCEALREVVYQGARYWTIEQGCYKVENPHGGTSTGMDDFLLRVE